jgi:hypothetical protein
VATKATERPATGPYATAEAFQTLKSLPRLLRRILDDVELGNRAGAAINGEETAR